ncbi:MAG: M1 family aminopeptidase [Bacteroidota bacterium]|nr:M1 family aminopeptidase [Bacteroidota bacterium]
MKKISFLTLSLSICTILFSQTFNYPDYWKTRKPYADYWQQDVHYTIDAVIDDEKDEIKGTEKLVYYNNSPDELKVVYFHLYQNAFQPGSYAHALNQVNHEHTEFGKYEALKMGTVLDDLKVNGKAVKYRLDNTILIVELNEPIAPNTSTTFDIQFRTYWDNGSMRRRFKSFSPDGINKHFDGVHWYPRICVYDSKFGWETEQHLGKEFYGDFGVYDVKLTFPSNYIVEATGELTNESTVLPADFKQSLNIQNYVKDKSYKVVIPRNGTKTWIYHAENVHDFAFTADPTYRMDEVIWNGIKCIAIAQEQNAPYWGPTAKFVANVVEIYSTDFGMYGYPKIVAADARDGMEYPMITLNGGNWPGHQYVIAHEVGHNWFFGMIGNNETYRAMLDEGFTQFLTSWSIKRFNKMPIKASRYDESSVYNGYLFDAANKDDATLNTHSDDFSSAIGHGGGYRHVYYKTATMLYNLQYVLGDELFLNAMKHYFNKWKFAHPYPEDFRKAIIEYTKVDLNWFFDQWMETTKSIDYRIVRQKSIKSNDPNKKAYEIKFKRVGDMQMPLDITVKDKNNKTYNYLIPNTYFAKNEGQTVLKTWKGWGLLNKTYKDTIYLDNKIRSIQIDTSNRLADIDRMDNKMVKRSHNLPYVSTFNKGIAPYSGFNHRNFTYRPDVWFNAVDGVKVGVNTHFDYARVKHVMDVSVWYNTGFGAEKVYKAGTERDVFSYRLKYKHSVGKDAFVFWDTRYLDGIFYDDLGFEKSFGKDQFIIHYKSIGMTKGGAKYWPYANSTFREERSNTSLNIDHVRRYRYKNGNGAILSTLRGNGLTQDYGFGSFKSEVINQNKIGKLDLKTRFFIQVIAGNNIPEEVLINLSGANMEQLLESKFTRSRGFIPEQWLGFGNTINHFHQGGGLNLRGYSGYLAPVTKDNQQYALYQGNAGISGSLELDFDRLIRFKPKFTRNWLRVDAYLFADAGILTNTDIADGISSPLRMDAGVGTTWHIYRWGKRNLIAPLSLRLDAPFFLNTPPFADKGYLQSRWVVGIGRSF